MLREAKTNKLKGKPVCVQKSNCAKCNSLINPRNKHECFKQYCSFRKQNREAGHYCYMRPLVNELPRSDNVLCVFYDFETTEDTRLTESSTVHIPNLACIQNFCTVCENDLILTRHVCGVLRGNMRSGMIPWAISCLIFVSRGNGVRELLQLHTMRKALMPTLF